jgi:uncharacterized protein (TIRG00374 family)
VRRAMGMAAFAGGLGAVALLCWRFGLENVGVAFARMSPQYLVLYLGFGCLVRVGYGARWHLVAEAFGASRELWRLVAARLAGDAVGSLLPSGRVSGDPVRLALVYEEKAGGARAGASVAADRVIEMISSILCGLAYVAVFASTHAFGSSRRTVWIWVGIMLLMLAALAMPLAMLRRGIRIGAPVDQFILRSRFAHLQGWVRAVRRTEDQLIRFLQFHPGTLVCGILGSFCIEGLHILEYHFLLTTFGIDLDLPTLLLALVATGFAHVVPTPAGLGALEASEVSVLALAHGRPDVGFVVGVVIRLHETLWAVVGLAVLSAQGIFPERWRWLTSANKVTV